MKIITLPHKHTNAFLIGNEPWLMVDAGYPESYIAFKTHMKEQGIDWSNIFALMVTHFHPDHAGLVQTIRERNIPLLLHKSQKGYVAWINSFFEKHIHKKYVPIKPEGIRYINSHESRFYLNQHGLKGEIIPTPGHSKDSVSLVIDGDCAFVGDLQNYHISIEAGLPVESRSWGDILSFGVKTIYPTHGIPYHI